MEKHQEVIDQIRRLAGEFLVRSGDAGQGGLDALFPDLLGDAFGALGDQFGGPAFGRIGGGPFGDGPLQPGDAAETRRVGGAENVVLCKR